MTRVLVVALALGAGAMATPAAANAAAAADRVRGGCAFAADDEVGNLVGQDHHSGVIYDHSATTTRLVPTDATVTCWRVVNGVEVPGARFSYSGFGVQGGADRISFVTAPGDIYYVCESVAFADGGTVPACGYGHTEIIFPPPVVTDLVDDTWAWVVAPAACPAAATLAGTYGPVTIAPNGDVSVDDPFGLGTNPITDCPPSLND
jgi:hypothetical protein